MRPGDLIELTVPTEHEGSRLDRWLADELGAESSRSQIQHWIAGGCVIGNEPEQSAARTAAQSAARTAAQTDARTDAHTDAQTDTQTDARTAAQTNTRTACEPEIKASAKIKAGAVYRIKVPAPILPDLTPRDLNLRVIYEDDEIAVIVKPPGLSVHPGPGDADITLLNGLLYLWKDLPAGADDYRPGIVHRLDKPTEGLLAVAKNELAHRRMSAAFKNREIYKEYLAWLLAAPRETRGTVKLPIERHPSERLKMRIAETALGRDATTHYDVQQTIVSRRGRKYARALIRIDTGRTHQIRVHMSHLGSPVVGDPLYSRSASRFEKFGLLLLARRLRFCHPVSGKELEFELETPERFLDFERECDNL